jgi:gluconolactonase
MSAESIPSAARLPGPPELLPGRPDAVIDLQTHEGAALVGGEWRYRDAEVEEIDFVEVGPDLGPSGAPNRTYDVVPHAQGGDFDDSDWEVLQPPDTERRLGAGRVSFNWYRINVTIPERVGDLDPTGATVVFEVVVDDYAEVWVDGALPLAIGQAGGQVVGGFNFPNRVILGTDVRPGQQFQIAVFGMNGPISASPTNYIWMRTATLDIYAPQRARRAWQVPFETHRADAALEAVIPADARLERVAGGFEFTEGPVWARDGALLFSSPNTNVIYRWAPAGTVSVFRTKSGYTGPDIGRFAQPGSNGLTFDPEGLLTICQHGNRRVMRVNPHGDTTVLADRYEGRRLNSPNDLVYRSDGALFFTDPPFGLPKFHDDPRRELPHFGVYSLVDGRLRLVSTDLTGPNGLAFSPDERYLYVSNWDEKRKVIMRYEAHADGTLSSGRVFFDMGGAPGAEALDGLKVDRLGNVYASGPGGLWIIAPDGRHLGTIRGPELPTNFAWGDADGRTLYLTARTGLYRIRLNVPGIRP